jgi:RIO-like serine/threonine protein kinase
MVSEALINLASLQGEQEVMAVYFNYSSLINVHSRSLTALGMLSFIAGCAVLVRNYRLVKEPDQCRRIKWVVYGLLAGSLPFSIYFSASFVLTNAGYGYLITSYAFEILYRIATIATGIIPITIGYAILKHRVFDINVVVRRGLQYLLAKNVLRLILALPIIGVTYGIISNPNRTLKEMLFEQPIYPLLIAAAALSLKFRRRLSTWVDRRFFREAYSQEQILLRLIDEIKEFNSMPEIAKLVSRKVDSALHLQRIYVFYREANTRDLTLGYSSGGFSPSRHISEAAQLLRLMEGQPGAREYPFPQQAGLPPDERAWLDQLQVNLLVPMSGTDERLVGLLLLGEKKSEQPYTATDRQLLLAIARQMAVAYEMVWLKGRVDEEEKIKREVLARLEAQQVNLLKECPACGACYDSAAQVCAKDRSELTLTLPVERTIEGKYRLEQLIGKGGMGAVYEATDLRLDRKVAIKLITGSMFGDRAALRRFEREARASARLNHPNIIAVYDYGAVGAEGAYLVMELVRGITLRAELKRAGQIPPAVAAAWFDQILEGMKTAHQAGIIHRDLKPENILIAKQEHDRPLVKVLDFGLAKLRMLNAADPNSLTVPGTVMGTFGYMSPEQLAGEEVDERSDLFSIGVMAVEALTGSRPFSGRTYAELLTAILHQPFHLRGEVAEIQRLDEVLQKCLAKDRAQRYATIAELQGALIPAIGACPPFVTPAAASGDEETTSLPTV